MKRRLLDDSSHVLEKYTSSAKPVSFLVVKSSARAYAIPVDFVDEVFEMVAVSELAEKKAGVVGLLDYHGELLVLFDLAALAGAGTSEINPNNIVVVCTIEEYRFAVMGAETSDVVTVENHEITTSEEIMSGILKEIGVIRNEETTASIVDLWSAILSVQTGVLENEPSKISDSMEARVEKEK